MCVARQHFGQRLTDTCNTCVSAFSHALTSLYEHTVATRPDRNTAYPLMNAIENMIQNLCVYTHYLMGVKGHVKTRVELRHSRLIPWLGARFLPLYFHSVPAYPGAIIPSPNMWLRTTMNEIEHKVATNNHLLGGGHFSLVIDPSRL